MTALVLMRLDDGILIASDGAAYRDDGLLHSHATKVALMPEWSCIMGGRGIGCALSRLYLMLQTFSRNGTGITGFDAVLDALPDLSRFLKQQYDENLPGEQHFSFMIGGYSERRGAWETYILRSRPNGVGEAPLDGEQPAFTLIPLPNIHLAPLASDEGLTAVGILPPRDGPRDPVAEAIRFICAARLDKGWSERRLDAPAQHLIGGFVQVTVLTRDSVTSSIAHRWPDLIGEPIVLRGDLLPEALRPLDSS